MNRVSSARTTLSSVTSVQWVASWSAAALLPVVVAMVGWIGFSRPVRASLFERQAEEWKRKNSLLVYKGGFVSWTHRLMLDELPGADYSRGVACFLGSSNLVSSLKTWELPPTRRAVVHNYGIPGADHADQLRFVRYLIEHDGLLSAGRGKAMVVLGLSWVNAQPMDYFESVFGPPFFVCDDMGDLHPAPMGPVERWVRYSWSRSRSFALASRRNLRLEGLRIEIYPRFSAKRGRAPEAYVRMAETAMGPDWERRMGEEMDSLDTMVGYLRDQEVPVVAVLLPVASWHRGLPYVAFFRERATALCASSAVPLVDLEAFLADEEFDDGFHPNYRGTQKTHVALMAVVEPHLDSLGVAD